MKKTLFILLSALLIVSCHHEEAPKEIESSKDEIQAEVTENKTQIPENCSVWFDGCNNCMIQEGSDVGACTRKFCPAEAMEEPKCLEYRK